MEDFDQDILPRCLGDPSGYYFPLSKEIPLLLANKTLRHEALPVAFRPNPMEDFCSALGSVPRPRSPGHAPGRHAPGRHLAAGRRSIQQNGHAGSDLRTASCASCTASQLIPSTPVAVYDNILNERVRHHMRWLSLSFARVLKHLGQPADSTMLLFQVGSNTKLGPCLLDRVTKPVLALSLFSRSDGHDMRLLFGLTQPWFEPFVAPAGGPRRFPPTHHNPQHLRAAIRHGWKRT
jgi:hypothetical protein